MRQKLPKKKQFLTKKQKTMSGLIGGLIILIMVGSALNFYDEDAENKQEYNGIEFMNTGNGWLGYTEEGREVSILTSPAELKNITTPNIDISNLNLLQKIYITYDPRHKVRGALYQFQKSISLSPRLVGACTVDVELCAEMPLKTCKDASSTVGIILFEESNETAISLNNNCLTIKGKDLVKLTDKLVVEQAK
jgi:hypothetical protein